MVSTAAVGVVNTVLNPSRIPGLAASLAAISSFDKGLSFSRTAISMPQMMPAAPKMMKEYFQPFPGLSVSK